MSISDRFDAGVLLSRIKTGVVRRSAWVLVDQMLSSLTNFALAVLAARNLSVEGFGAFGVTFALYLFAIGVSNGQWAVPVTITHADAAPREAVHQISRAAGAALVSGLIVTPMLVIAGVLIGGDTGKGFLALAICLGGLLLQDAWRRGFVAIGRPRLAAANDLAWAICQLAAVVAVIVLVERPTVFGLMLAWGLSGVAAGALGSLQVATPPRIRGLGELWSAHRRLGPRFVGEFIVQSGQGHVTLFLLAAYAGTAASAGFRGAQLVYGPQRVLQNGLTLGLLPEAVRVREHWSRMRLIVMALSALSVAIMVVSLLALLALPDRWGAALLGQTWRDAEDLLVPMGLFTITGAIAAGPAVGLRALGDARRCLRNQSVSSVSALVTTLVGIVAAGAAGAAWGLAVAGVVHAVVWSVSWARRATRGGEGERAPAASVDEGPG